jgi:hypothetical protein
VTSFRASGRSPGRKSVDAAPAHFFSPPSQHLSIDNED